MSVSVVVVVVVVVLLLVCVIVSVSGSVKVSVIVLVLSVITAVHNPREPTGPRPTLKEASSSLLHLLCSEHCVYRV